MDLLRENHLIILLLIMWSQNTFPLGPFCFIKGSRWLIEKCLLHMWKYSWLSPRLFSPLHTKQIIVPYSYLYSLPQKYPDMISYIIQILHNEVFFLKLHCSAYLFLILLYNCFLLDKFNKFFSASISVSMHWYIFITLFFSNSIMFLHVSSSLFPCHVC